MRYLIAILAIGGLGCTSCAGAFEHIHVHTAFEQSCADACLPGVCQSAVDTGLNKAKSTTCDDIEADLCICSLE